MTPRFRQMLLYGTALATVMAAVFAPKPEDPVQPSLKTTQPLTNPPLPSPAAKNKLTPITTRSGLKHEPGDLFLVDKPPPSPTVAQAHTRLPPPIAPPLPYRYMGKMLENGELTVFLTREDKPYIVHAGDVLDSQYRVDAIQPPLIELTYLPLKQKQLLSMGEIK